MLGNGKAVIKGHFENKPHGAGEKSMRAESKSMRVEKKPHGGEEKSTRVEKTNMREEKRSLHGGGSIKSTRVEKRKTFPSSIQAPRKVIAATTVRTHSCCNLRRLHASGE